jgi:hypothetical protein
MGLTGSAVVGIVTTAVPFWGIEAGTMDATTPVGSPVTDSAIGETYPPTALAVTLNTAGAPFATVRLAGLIAREKSGAAATVREKLTVFSAIGISP